MKGRFKKNESNLANRFSISEWSGAVGDLGTMLPLAFALVMFNDFSPQRLFFLWGVVYVVTGFVFRVPVSVQPLKVMAVIAIATGCSVAQLASSALFFGCLLIILSLSGAIRWLERWFSPALVRGVQLGIGLILMHKALAMIHSKGFYFGQETDTFWLNVLIMLIVIIVLGFLQFWQNKPVSIFIIFFSIGLSILFGVRFSDYLSASPVVQLNLPDMSFFSYSLIYLIIPQLPLTLGNAVFAANDACHTFWQKRARKVNPTRFGFSIGISNVLIGLLGGFPICHGAGGIAAHAKFGGKTGGTAIIIGSILILIAVIKPLTVFLFYIPIPILGALLLFTSWSMIFLVRKLDAKIEFVVALTVGVLAYFTSNLSIALIIGFIIERGYQLVQQRFFGLKGKKV